MLRKLLLTLCFALTSITTAWGVDYNLKVNGTVVTSSNASNLSVISGVSGTVRYDANTSTLYLEDATITGSVNGAIYSWSPLTINLSGANTVTTTGYYGFLLDDYCTITGNGSLCLTASSSGYDIELRQSDGVTITGGASVLLLGGGGIDNDGDWDETVTIDGANLYVRRGSPSTTSFFVKNVEMRNARLACPSWTNAAWEDGELSQGGQEWKGDIFIMANAGNDVNGDGDVNLADVTKLVNIILDKDDPHEYVDLGLPSGTLWATCNVGAGNSEDYGDSFAWGETATKTWYDWSHYKYCNGSKWLLTKYCCVSSYGADGFTDGKTELELEDDAATVNWGSKWRMPSKEQFDELINSSNTTTTWTTQNGVNGCLITSNTNGKSLFLPAAGYHFNLEIGNEMLVGSYWSRTLREDDPCNAWYMTFRSGSINATADVRYTGRSVRPVRAQ